MRFVLCIMLLVLVSALPAAAATWQVIAQDFEFVPSTLTIQPGDTVVWTNVQGGHNVYYPCNPSLFGNAVMEAPWTYTFVFDVPPGDYPYLCEVHPDIMLGVISVQSASPHRWDVTVQDFSFTPSNLSVQQGDTVVWTNIGGFHSVHHTGVPSLFGNEVAAAPWTYSFVFNLAVGVYSYLCEAHPETMTGNIAVLTAPAAPQNLTIRPAGTDVILRWSSVPGAGCYTIWRAQNVIDPAFSTLVGITPDTVFIQNHIALTGIKQFFQIRAISN